MERRRFVGRHRTTNIGIWMLRELTGDVGRRPERELGNHPGIRIGCKRPNHVPRENIAGRQPLADFHLRIGGENVCPRLPAGALFEHCEGHARLNQRIDVVDVVDGKPSVADEPHGSSLEAHQRGDVRAGEIRSVGEGLGELRICEQDEPIDQLGR
jgi:hypothetical protein